ncbi:hypothetical protein L1987_06585 [Smallanthus sonchifolius]|uniref:Uncharacterized protein n=1 Tax=Smallanthus sonchifolius TaxID=185202 RepID=A0ACB9JYX1_9ASTR|nr:hypothetical protein L1987_06585 [Smallanthus sonchifolius]
MMMCQIYQLLERDYTSNGWIRESSEPELSEHSDEQQEQEEVGSEDGMSEDEGDEEQGIGGAEDSDSSTESDSSDSDDAPSQAHLRRLTKVTFSESSSKRKRQETSSEYEPNSDSDAAIQRRRRESINKQCGIGRNKLSFMRRQRRRPRVTPEVAIAAITEEVPVIVSLPVPSVQVAGFDFDTIFSSPLHNAEASTSRNPDPDDTRITTLETQVAGLLETVQKSREESEAQRAQINSLVDEDVFRGEREKEKEKASKSSGDEACHPVDLTKGDDKDKDHEVGSSGSEQQALEIVPISVVPMAEGESTHQEAGDASGGNKGKSVADVFKNLSDDVSDNVILFLEPGYSKEAQIEALCNLEEGEIDSGDDWDEEDDDVVIEVPKDDEEGEYEFEDGEIFEVPSFESHLHAGSVELASTVEASTEASPTDPTPMDPEA